MRAVFIAMLLAGCAQYQTADHYIPEMKRLAEDVGLTCPEAKPAVIYAETSGRAYTPGGPLPGGTIFLPSKYDPSTEQGKSWSSGPQGHRLMAHEVAHICGANEQQARAVECRWWQCDGGFNRGLSAASLP
jgi:hypothetical protein